MKTIKHIFKAALQFFFAAAAVVGVGIFVHLLCRLFMLGWMVA